MIKGLEELRQKRLKWIESSRENNFEDGIKRLLTDLYPDNAHFIYELLQNAEDPKASTVRFTVTNEAVEFEHNGERLFNLKDVESITSIGASTKRDDPTSIGKFGVGFKAVFAYTSTPEIHSGDFHFRIHDLVVPETNEVEKLNAGEGKTSFTFPFDHPTKKPAQAAAEVERALRALGDNTLLFLKHIRTIEYVLPDGASGSLERVDHENGHIEILASHPGGKDTVSHWIRFEQNVDVIDEDGLRKNCGIAIAYQLEKASTQGKRRSAWEIVPNSHGQVSIFFPAEKETSNLRFHIHAPFASTVARDSVRDCEANDQLRNHIADLVVDSLRRIRGEGMLTVGFLSVLPNPADNLSSFYEPIRQAVVRAFIDQDLTPTKNASHAPASTLFRGPAKISGVLNDTDLSLLTNSKPPLWAANPPQQNQREDRFLDSLKIRSWGWSELTRALSTYHDDEREAIEAWIAQKDDAWVRRFYALLGEALEEHYESVSAEDIRIVRVEAGEGHDHVTPSEAFFPLEQQAVFVEDVYFVKPEVYSSGRSSKQKKLVESFLESVGVRPFNERAVVELKLQRYSSTNVHIGDDHYDDIKQFVAYWIKNPEDISMFKEEMFMLSDNAKGELYWRTPPSIIIDLPYIETGLSDFVNTHHKYPIWEGYKDKLPSPVLKDFISFSKAVGVMCELKLERKSTQENPHKNELWRDYNRAGVKWTNTVINEDYSISNIERYLSACTVLASRLIWNALISADRKAATARFRPNQQYPTRESESQLVYHLKRHAWIPDITGGFRKPEDMTKDDLRKDFPFDDRNGLLTAIGFGAHARKRSEEYQVRNNAAKEIGFDSAEQAEAFAKLSKAGLTPEELQDAISRHRHVSQPEESIPNPERRRQGVLERRANAPTKESVNRERVVQPGAKSETLEAKAYLRSKYRNLEGQLVCQCCHAEMPFKVRDNHYFEAIQCVRGIDHHYFENRLALCPTCAAMYRHARETDDAEIRQAIVELDVSVAASSAEIMVRLAGEQYKLRFVGTHWFDLKTVLSGR